MKPLDPLTRFSIINTNSPEEAEDILSKSLTDLRIMNVKNQPSFSLRMNGVNFGETSLVFNRLGTNTTIRSNQPGEAVIFVFGGSVPSTFYLDNEPVVVSPRRGAIIGPGQKICVERLEKSKVFVLRANLSDLNHHLEQLADMHCKASLVFDHSIDLTSGPGFELMQKLKHLVYELDFDDIRGASSRLHKSLNEMLLTALFTLPNNHSEKLSGNHSSNYSPKMVRMAEEYMRAHLEEPITITDLLKICGCSRSGLFSAFKNSKGYTPLEFLTELRLQNARKRLLNSDDGTLVTSVAYDHGFIHMGRFSQVYRKRFGELPSTTLKR